MQYDFKIVTASTPNKPNQLEKHVTQIEWMPLQALRLLLQWQSVAVWVLVFQACVLYGGLWVNMRPLSMLRVCAMYVRSMRDMFQKTLFVRPCSLATSGQQFSLETLGLDKTVS